MTVKRKKCIFVLQREKQLQRVKLTIPLSLAADRRRRRRRMSAARFINVISIHRVRGSLARGINEHFHYKNTE